MSALSRILSGALIAGFLAGLVAATLQLVFIQPVLLTAELYESGQVAAGESPVVPAPGFDGLRDGLSVMFSALVYVGYGLVLMAIMAVASERGWARVDGRAGVVWGLAGFVTAQLAPALGLPPELPGMSAAALEPRQAWWSICVLLSGLGCALIGFGRNWMFWGAGIVCLAAPQLIGAPSPETMAGPVPPELAAEFAARALGAGLVAWTCLGALSGRLWSEEAGRPALKQA